MKVEIDPGAGPCFGVERAIDKAEQVLEAENKLICVGDLIHNEQEILRLERLGMQISSLKEVINDKDKTVLFRAHGEPPSSFNILEKENIRIIDTTCPIVVKLQKQIANTYLQIKDSTGTIVIYGKKTHPEIISLLGHCEQKALIIEDQFDIMDIDFENPIFLFSQTTKYRSEYLKIKDRIERELILRDKNPEFHLVFNDSSCKIVAKRDLQLKEFIEGKDLVIFVSGKKSSNGHQLFQICVKSSVTSYFVSNQNELDKSWFHPNMSIGISGATSTPFWLLEQIKRKIEELL